MERCPYCNEPLSEKAAVAETHVVSCRNHFEEHKKTLTIGARVRVYAPEDPLLKYEGWTEATGKILRFRNGKVRVSVDGTASQDTEGHDGYSDFEYWQVSLLEELSAERNPDSEAWAPFSELMEAKQKIRSLQEELDQCKSSTGVTALNLENYKLKESLRHRVGQGVELHDAKKKLELMRDVALQALSVLDEMPNDYKNCNVESYEKQRSRLRGILNQIAFD